MGLLAVEALVKIVLVLLVLVLLVAYMTYAERKIVGFMQVRLGPMRVGPWGLLQPIADVVKLLIKEDITPTMVDKWVYWIAPVLAVVPAFLVFSVIPWGDSVAIFGRQIGQYVADINVALLFILAVMSMGIYGIILGGYSSNSKYPLLGGLRSAAQMVSYEVPRGFAIIGVILIAQSMSLVDIVKAQEHSRIWYFVPQLVGFVIYFISSVAECNRSPFDLPEAESELVGGFHTEYSGIKFAFFFLAEYTNMIAVSAVAACLYLGGWLPPFPNWLPWLKVVPGIFWFLLKVALLLYLFLWFRATFPRYRYDQLMRLNWKWMIPVSIINAMVTGLALILWS
ncbi:MAG: NADH-quinone oxidoreductase subunit NuoH [Acidobacteriota bacterium]